MKHKIGKTIRGLLVALFIAMPLCGVAFPGEDGSGLEKLFDERSWAGLDAAVQGSASLTVKDMVLYGNSLWFRGDYQKGLEVFLGAEKDVPPEILPYLRMRVILGLERTGRAEEALKEALALGGVEEPVLAPYVQYAIGRLSRSVGDTGTAVGAFRTMESLATDIEQRKTALKALFDLSAAGIEEARRLLEMEPRNSEALGVLQSAGPPFEPGDALVLAAAALFERNYEKALDYIENVGPGEPHSRNRLQFIAARANALLGMKGEAADILYGLAVSRETERDVAAESVSVLKGMAQNNGDYEKGLLAALAESGDDLVSAHSMAALAEIYRREGDGKRKTHWEDRLMNDHPESPLSIPICWERGWKAWKGGKPEAAAALWEAALAAGPQGRDESKLVFWLGRAWEKTGKDATVLSERLQRQYPLDYYTFAAFPSRPLPVSHDDSALLDHQGSDLQDWGFMVYARMHLIREGSPGALYRAALISRWLGDHHGSYIQANAIFRMLPGTGSLPPELMEALFPTPYAGSVRKASERFGIPAHDIWAIMRRESAFNPMALSHVGAMGLMQLMPPTAKENARMLGLGEDLNFFDPEVNVLLGTHHFKRLRHMFDEVEHAVAAYNAGQGRVKSWLEAPWGGEEWVEEIPFDETREFVRQVLTNRNVYMRLQGGAEDEEQGRDS